MSGLSGITTPEEHPQPLLLLVMPLLLALPLLPVTPLLLGMPLLLVMPLLLALPLLPVTPLLLGMPLLLAWLLLWIVLTSGIMALIYLTDPVNRRPDPEA